MVPQQQISVFIVIMLGIHQAVVPYMRILTSQLFTFLTKKQSSNCLKRLLGIATEKRKIHILWICLCILRCILFSSRYMGPDSMDSPTCLGKKACLPLGGQSVWSIAGKPDARSKILIATGMDALTDFYGDRGDSYNAGVRVSVLLAIAEALSSIELSNATSQVLIAFFEGENWGRLGSRSFVSDLQNFQCLQEISREDSPINDRLCTSPLRVCFLLFVNDRSRLLSRSFL